MQSERSPRLVPVVAGRLRHQEKKKAPSTTRAGACIGEVARCPCVKTTEVLRASKSASTAAVRSSRPSWTRTRDIQLTDQRMCRPTPMPDAQEKADDAPSPRRLALTCGVVTLLDLVVTIGLSLYKLSLIHI